MFGERDEGRRRALTVGPLHAGRYAVIIEGHGVVKTIDLAHGEELKVPFAEWRPEAEEPRETER